MAITLSSTTVTFNNNTTSGLINDFELVEISDTVEKIDDTVDI